MNTAILLSLATLTPVPDSWLDAVEKIESRGHAIYGDMGLAKGHFQFHKGAWEDCSKLRAEAGLPVYSYDDAMNREYSREYARSWLTYLRAKLSARYGREAHLGETWLAYNLGMKGFGEYNYNWVKVDGWRYRKAVEVMMTPTRMKSHE